MFFEFCDIQQAVESLPGLRLNYRQLEAGPVRIALELQTVGEIGSSLASLDRLVDGYGYVQPGTVLFMLCLGGIENRYDDLSVCPGQVYFKDGTSPPGHQFVRPGYHALMLNLPCRLLEDHLRLPLAARLARGAVLDLNPRVAEGIVDLIRESPLVGAQGQRQLSDRITTALCQGLGLEGVADAPRQPHSKFKLARAIRERLQECGEMTLGDICSDLCISERTLRRVFSEAYAVSPGQYHLALRLNQVREEL